MTGNLERPISLVVPVVADHDQFIPSLLANLRSEQELIAKVVIARSALPLNQQVHYREWLERVKSEVEFDAGLELAPDEEPRLAGANRNRGWRAVQSPWTAFVDADDWYAPYRLEEALGAAIDFDANLVLHDYWNEGTQLQDRRREVWDRKHVIESEQLITATTVAGPRRREAEGTSQGDTNIVVPPNPSGHTAVHHAHVLVRTTVRGAVQYGTLNRSEDGQFCRDVLFNEGGVIYVPARLSAYNFSRSTGGGAPLIGRLRRRLSDLKRFGTVRPHD